MIRFVFASAFTIVAMLPQFSSAQTKDIEQEFLMKRLEGGEITGVQLNELAQRWRKLLDDLGGYPELPYRSETGQIDFNTVIEFPGISKHVIYKRVLEWTALTFGSIQEVLHYQDPETGKIIIKGYFPIVFREDYESFWGAPKEQFEQANCYQTWMFTTLDYGLKLEILGIRFEIRNRYYYNGWYTSTKTTQLDELYPVTREDPSEWKARLDMLNVTTKKFAAFQLYLRNYIAKYESDYNFLNKR